MKSPCRSLRYEHVVSVHHRSDRKIWLNLEPCSSLFKSERDVNQSAVARPVSWHHHAYKGNKQRPKEGTNDKGAILRIIVVPSGSAPVSSRVQPFQIWPFLSTLQMLMLPDERGVSDCQLLSLASHPSPAPAPSAPAKAKSFSHAPNPVLFCRFGQRASRVQRRQRSPTKLAKNMHIKYLMFLLIIFKRSEQCKLITFTHLCLAYINRLLYLVPQF